MTHAQSGNTLISNVVRRHAQEIENVSTSMTRSRVSFVMRYYRKWCKIPYQEVQEAPKNALRDPQPFSKVFETPDSPSDSAPQKHPPWVQHGFNMPRWVQHGFNISRWVQHGFNMDSTWFHMDSTWFNMDAAWVQHGSAGVLLGITWIQHGFNMV